MHLILQILKHSDRELFSANERTKKSRDRGGTLHLKSAIRTLGLEIGGCTRSISRSTFRLQTRRNHILPSISVQIPLKTSFCKGYLFKDGLFQRQVVITAGRIAADRLLQDGLGKYQSICTNTTQSH